MIYMLLLGFAATGGDCSAVDGYPDCDVAYPEDIGNGVCNEDYNTVDCGYDGGDCTDPLYPNCNVPYTYAVGDGYCDGGPDDGNFNTEACGYDGGDCVWFNTNYPNCYVDFPSDVGDGVCDGGDYDTAACGYDGGDCL